MNFSDGYGNDPGSYLMAEFSVSDIEPCDPTTTMWVIKSVRGAMLGEDLLHVHVSARSWPATTLWSTSSELPDVKYRQTYY
jgi:hypothetical protein